MSPWLCLRNECIVVMIPVSVPLSTRNIEAILFVSYRCSKYQRPILFGWELLSQIFNHRIFLLAVSIEPYIANGNVLFWYPINLSWPSIECTKLVPLVVKLPLTFLFLAVGSRASSPSGSTSNITACTKFLGTFRWYSCLILLYIALYPNSFPGPLISFSTAVLTSSTLHFRQSGECQSALDVDPTFSNSKHIHQNLAP